MDTAVKEEVGHYIGGRVVSGSSGRYGDVYNPATGEVARQVALASADEVRHAIANAAEAFIDWAEVPPARRVQVLYRYRELLIQNMDELARLLSSEHGKTVEDAKGSITRGLSGRVCLRDSAAAEGRVQRRRVQRRRFLEHAAAPGRGRRHYALQLSGDGAHVDVSGCDRMRQYFCTQAF